MAQMKLTVAGFTAGALSVCLALTGCGGTDPSATFTEPVISDQAASTLSLSSDDGESNQAPTYNLQAVIYRLRNVTPALFQHYGLRFGEDWNSSRAYRTMIGEVSFVVKNGVVTVTNKSTGGVIFTGRLTNLSSGVFSPENIPGGAITPPPSPSACTYAYSAFGACQSNGTQTRTVVSSTPAGCVGIPSLSQSCSTPPVLDGAALYASTCASCHGPLATSSKKGRTAAQITSAGMTKGLTAAQVQAVAAALAGTTPPAPVACSYTTGTWGACQSNSTQTRTVTSFPAGCTGTTPASSQACTYVPPVLACTSFTYSAWGTCSATGTQTRTVATSAPAGCTGGTRVVSQSCTPPAPPPADGAALYASTCASCHGPLATSAKLGRTAAQITAAGMTKGLTAAQVQAVAAALATVVPPPPATTGAALYTQYCSGCHGNGMKGQSASTIQSRINSNTGGMGSLKSLTPAQIAAISNT
jgi:mono/diheme cytochrome c family protein